MSMLFADEPLKNEKIVAAMKWVPTSTKPGASHRVTSYPFTVSDLNFVLEKEIDKILIVRPGNRMMHYKA